MQKGRPPTRTWRQVPVSRSHTRAVQSLDSVTARRPSRLTRAALTPPLCTRLASRSPRFCSAHFNCTQQRDDVHHSHKLPHETSVAHPAPGIYRNFCGEAALTNGQISKDRTLLTIKREITACQDPREVSCDNTLDRQGLPRRSRWQADHLTCIVFRSHTEMLLSKSTVTPTFPLLDTAKDFTLLPGLPARRWTAFSRPSQTNACASPFAGCAQPSEMLSAALASTSLLAQRPCKCMALPGLVCLQVALCRSQRSTMPVTPAQNTFLMSR